MCYNWYFPVNQLNQLLMILVCPQSHGSCHIFTLSHGHMIIWPMSHGHMVTWTMSWAPYSHSLHYGTYLILYILIRSRLEALVSELTLCKFLFAYDTSAAVLCLISFLSLLWIKSHQRHVCITCRCLPQGNDETHVEHCKMYLSPVQSVFVGIAKCLHYTCVPPSRYQGDLGAPEPPA